MVAHNLSEHISLFTRLALYNYRVSVRMPQLRVAAEVSSKGQSLPMWYAANLLFETTLVPSVEGDVPLQEESVRLLEADSETDAHEAAFQLGEESELSYEGACGQMVTWRFIKVLEVQDLCEAKIHSGMEVFSRLKWKETRDDNG